MQYVTTLTVDELNEILNKSLTSFLKQMKAEIEANLKEESNLVNIKIVMEILHVTKPTIYNWIKKGYIQPQKIAGKVLFNLPVILKSLKLYDNKLRKCNMDFSQFKITL